MSTGNTRAAITRRRRSWYWSCVSTGALVLVLAGCGTNPLRDTTGPTPVKYAPIELPEQQLLNVGIQIFDSGELSEEQAEERGMSEEIREAEARFIPVHLKNTMQKTGHWGAVRVLPPGSDNVEVLVRGSIRDSDGEVLDLRITAFDASGRQWLDKSYRAKVEAGRYDASVRGEQDAFQDLYNAIANDLAEFKGNLDASQVRAIRRISELEFAADIAPEAFGDHLATTEKGLRQPQRLPAQNDPILARVLRIREREYMLIDTVNGYYDSLYVEMWDPYVNWRQFRNEEAVALRKTKQEAIGRTLIGVASMAGAVAMGLAGVQNTSGLQILMITGGLAVANSGLNMRQQAQLHEDALRELGVSFESEVTPLLIEVEGETIELTGSAATQFATWRRMLRQIYATETGLPGDRPDDTRPDAPAPSEEFSKPVQYF